MKCRLAVLYDARLSPAVGGAVPANSTEGASTSPQKDRNDEWIYQVHNATRDAVAGLAVTLASRSAWSADFVWLNAASGNWNLPANWAAASFPGENATNDTATISVTGAAYTVTLNVNPANPLSAFTLNSADAIYSASGRTFVVDGPANLTAGTVNWTGSNWNGTGPLTIGAAATFNATGTSAINSPLTQNGTLNVTATGAVANLTLPTGFTNNGNLNLTSTANSTTTLTLTTGDLINNGQVFAVAGSGGTRTITLADSFVNNGEVFITGTLIINGASPTFQNSATGLVRGSGTLNISDADLTFLNDGTFAPGNTLGVLTVTGNYVQSGLGDLEIEIGGTVVGEFDRLAVSGSANFAGDLEVFLDGFTPQAGDSFVIATFASRTGTFANTQAGVGGNRVFTADGLGSFQAIYTGTTLTLTDFEPIPEPATLALIAVAVGLMLLVGRRWRQRLSA